MENAAGPQRGQVRGTHLLGGTGVSETEPTDRRPHSSSSVPGSFFIPARCFPACSAAPRLRNNLSRGDRPPVGGSTPLQPVQVSPPGIAKSPTIRAAVNKGANQSQPAAGNTEAFRIGSGVSRCRTEPSRTSGPAQSSAEYGSEHTGGRHLYCFQNKRKSG